ncbi:MAG: IS630 family transposase [Rubrobacteraceae bacterium]
MKAHSEDLRRKIVEALKRGMRKSEAASLFGVSLSSVKRFAGMDRDGLSLAPRKPPGRPPKTGEAAKRPLEADLADRPAATVAERRSRLEHMTGLSLSDSTVGRLVGRLGHSRKKDPPASERDEFPRAAWRVMVSGEVRAERLVFVDEMGSNTSLFELYAYAPKGERAYCPVARDRGKNTTSISSMSLSGMGPSMVVEGGADGAVFEAYLQRMLAPTLREGDVAVMDNLRVRKSERVKELIGRAGAEVLHPPPYSPDFNPIEEAFSKIKNLLRKAGARVGEALVEALGVALSEVGEEDARAFFEHCGYREAVQLL